MAASQVEIDRLHRDTGTDEESLPTYEADAVFLEAEETYTGIQSRKAYARILVLQGLISRAAALTDYQQDTTSETASQVFANLYKLLAIWQSALDKARADEVAASTASAAQSLRVPVLSSW